MSLLEVSGLCAGYGRLQVLWDIDLTVKEGEVVAIIGPNGAGKTTLLKTIAGIVKPITGTIKFNGVEIKNTPVWEIIRRGLVYVPNGTGVLTNLTVYENLVLGAFVKKDSSYVKDRLKFIYDVFPVLAERKTQLASTLSGGEKQMLVLARALMSNPKLLLLDEPSTGLSPIMVSKIYEIINQLVNLKFSIVLVEQDVVGALKIADSAYLLEAGRIRVKGGSDEFLRDESIRKYYLGA
jgi:branched-chain amino acid transport system ATP-binding protein